jgi:CubicO group peptidase (beta-lactamase class C family)
MKSALIRSAYRALGIAVALVALPAALSAQDHDATDALMRQLMTADNVPGAALVLIKDGKVVLERGYGLRDLATQAPVTTETLFNIGSISKSFTALGIVQLADRQRVDLDAPAIKYAPGLVLGDRQTTEAVTLRQLLSHSSGFPADEKWPPRVPPTRQGIVDEFAAMAVTAPPGEKFQYCSRCIVLAAYILERVTDQSWETYTRARIFEPLGMTTAAFGPSGLQRAANRAIPYHHDPATGDIDVPWARLQYLEPLAPGGGIAASIADMARYALLQLDAAPPTKPPVVSAQMLAVLHHPEIAVGPGWAPERIHNLHYALGWFTGDDGDTHLVFHTGGNPGYRSIIVLVPAAKAGLVVLTNAESGRFTAEAAQHLLEPLLK